MAVVILSGNEITDAVRAANTQGDGLAAESSMGIWEATTNLCTNGGFGTNTAKWALYTGATISRVTSDYKFGAACLQVVTANSNYSGCQGGGDGPANGITVSSSTIYSASCWVKVPNGRDIVLTVQEFLADGTTYITETDFSDTGTGAWQKLRGTITTGATTERLRLLVHQSNTPTSMTFFLDGVQCEQQPLITPYVETDGASASRSAARVRVPASYIDETQSWVAVRLRMGWVNTADPSGNPVVFDWNDDANNLIQARFDTTGNTWELQRRNGGGTGEVTKAGTFALSAAKTVIFAWDATNLKVSVDGSVFTSAAATNIPTLAATDADIGSVAASEHIDSDVFWFACGTGTLSDANAATINGFGNTDTELANFPDTCVLVWPANTDAVNTGEGPRHPAHDHGSVTIF